MLGRERNVSASITLGKDWELWKRLGGFRKNGELCIAGRGEKNLGSSLGLKQLLGIPWGYKPHPEVPALFSLEKGSFQGSLIMDSPRCCCPAVSLCMCKQAIPDTAPLWQNNSIPHIGLCCFLLSQYSSYRNCV